MKNLIESTKNLFESHLRTLKAQKEVLVDTEHVTEFVDFAAERGLVVNGGGLEIDVHGFYGFQGQWLYID